MLDWCDTVAGQIEKAKQNVVRLKQLCPQGCEELEGLEKALAGQFLAR